MRDVFMRHYVTSLKPILLVADLRDTNGYVNIIPCCILILAFVNYNSNPLIDFGYFPVNKMTE